MELTDKRNGMIHRYRNPLFFVGSLIIMRRLLNSYFKNSFIVSFLVLNPLSLRFRLYMGRAAGFEPQLVKLAALPRYQ
jgi:hypothetical protein